MGREVWAEVCEEGEGDVPCCEELLCLKEKCRECRDGCEREAAFLVVCCITSAQRINAS